MGRKWVLSSPLELVTAGGRRPLLVVVLGLILGDHDRSGTLWVNFPLCTETTQTWGSVRHMASGSCDVHTWFLVVMALTMLLVVGSLYGRGW